MEQGQYGTDVFPAQFLSLYDSQDDQPLQVNMVRRLWDTVFLVTWSVTTKFDLSEMPLFPSVGLLFVII